MRGMDKVRKLIDSRRNKIIIELGKVGAKKVSRDTVEKNLDELKAELESYFAEKDAKFKDEAENLKNKLVITSLQDTLTNFRVMTNL